MKRVVIICEGETEREFCTTILAPHFINLDIYIQAPLIKKSMGGVVNWVAFKKEIENHLREKNLFVTTFIDYYGLQPRHKFPNWDESHKITDKVDRLNSLEFSMKEEIKDSVKHRFIPYLQLHEFEALLFYDINIFFDHFTESEINDINELRKTFSDYPNNPEFINDNPETSPSQRLKRIISGYNKVLYGSYLAEAIGLQRIRSKCLRFNEWIVKIESIR